MSSGASAFESRIAELVDRLRGEGLQVGTSELLDALAALGAVDWSDPARFRGALAATLAKSAEDQRVFEVVFEAFLHHAGEREALRHDVREDRPTADGSHGADGIVDTAELRRRVLEALLGGDDSALRDLARLAIATAGHGRGGSVGVDVQRIRRELGLSDLAHGSDGAGSGGRRRPTREQLRRFDAHVRRELERGRIERTRELPAAKPLSELDRSLPTGPLQDLGAVQRVVAQLRRRLATQGHQLRGHGRRAHLDIRRTMRASLQTGGAPVVIKHRPQRPRRPELYVLCDVSTSVSSASVFFLSVLHALHDSFRRMRSFVFVERVAEVTELFERHRSFRELSSAITGNAGVADVSGFTDYGRVWHEFLALVQDDLHPRSTVIVLGDARTNGRDPGLEAFAAICDRAGRTFWLNPEPRLYWNYGDSVIGAYGAHCQAHECWTPAQLEEFVKALTRPQAH